MGMFDLFNGVVPEDFSVSGMLPTFKPTPMSMGLLNAGGAILANQGWSRTPVSQFQQLGAGLQGFSQGAEQARKNQIEEEKAQAQLKHYQALNDYYTNKQTTGPHLVQTQVAYDSQNRPHIVGFNSDSSFKDMLEGTGLYAQPRNLSKDTHIDGTGRQVPNMGAPDALYQTNNAESQGKEDAEMTTFSGIINGTQYTDVPVTKGQLRQLVGGQPYPAGPQPQQPAPTGAAPSAATPPPGVSIPFPVSPQQPATNLFPQQGIVPSGKDPIKIKKDEKAAEQQIANEQSLAEAKGAQEKLGSIIDGMIGDYTKLDENGGMQNSSKDAWDNIQAAAGNSSIGREIGHQIGTKNEELRQNIELSIRSLLPALNRAAGVKATQMNSDNELKFYIDAASNPKLDVNTNLKALKWIKEHYGPGSKFYDFSESPSLQPQSQSQNVNIPHPSELKPGAVVGGYRYLGGDPANQSSWEKQ